MKDYFEARLLLYSHTKPLYLFCYCSRKIKSMSVIKRHNFLKINVIGRFVKVKICALDEKQQEVLDQSSEQNIQLYMYVHF